MGDRSHSLKILKGRDFADRLREVCAPPLPARPLADPKYQRILIPGLCGGEVQFAQLGFIGQALRIPGAKVTALMGDDEPKALQLLQHNRELLKPLIKQFHGDWLKEIGDGTLSSFSSAVEAVKSALAIQHVLKDDPDLQLRIGLHVGDVVFEEGDVFGDGVNVGVCAGVTGGAMASGGTGVSSAEAIGDQAGDQSLPSLLVSLVWPVPSAFMTYISGLPSRSEWKAIFPPSGDQAG